MRNGVLVATWPVLVDAVVAGGLATPNFSIAEELILRGNGMGVLRCAGAVEMRPSVGSAIVSSGICFLSVGAEGRRPDDLLLAPLVIVPLSWDALDKEFLRDGSISDDEDEECAFDSLMEPCEFLGLRASCNGIKQTNKYAHIDS